MTLVLIFSGLIAAGAIAADSYHAPTAASVCQAPAVSQAAPGGLVSASPRDLNPCDPTPGILLNCKANHGHFSTSCCCCITH
ncbi:MAG TPA: hypothetical protein VNI57_03810 [Candidatus Saccharimonadales bacterium]|nr:hypothetical protein [Candidatus Saccharimonadales bacterium]